MKKLRKQFKIFYIFFIFTGLCTTQDVDIFIRHMNNARYLRELDFARFHYYGLTGLYEAVRKHKGGAVQGASSVRYRKTIPIFSTYKIETKVCWNNSWIIHQHFGTLPKKKLHMDS